MSGAKSDDGKHSHKAAKPESPDSEILPDAWERFERAVDVVIKSGPQHKAAGPRNITKDGIKKKSKTGLRATTREI
ncbi:hypothetical protein [Methylocella tundrae]|uniref:hypothetical protein n=1 Tax=Methylocella tundrae TaxID=227605 RepID=UPI00106BC346|nr:hypothetical protein [Methylocella tundrae]WPP05931.1 hypothetical protein SIN04_09045 [Methylocella tundrae]